MIAITQTSSKSPRKNGEKKICPAGLQLECVSAVDEVWFLNIMADTA
jgi:hypothetical protein